LQRLTGRRPGQREALTGLLDGARSRSMMAAATVAAGGCAWLCGGPVAAGIASLYAFLGARAGRRAARERRAGSARAGVMDMVGGLAADLRAGAAQAVAVDAALRELPPVVVDPAVRRALDRVATARAVSERLGAPLADLLERVEADLRGHERARSAVAAQTAAARATAVLLALLPIAGVGLGAAMGVRPTHTLLHTPLGAACAFGAALLQCGGLAWTGRLCRAAVEDVS
jgi:tight adherence protein B